MDGEGGNDGDLGDDERVDIEIEEAVARNPRVARKPIAPTKAMILAHEVHHADYREWCDHCVAGKGVSHRHRSLEKEDGGCAEFSIDYAFITADGQVGYEEEFENANMTGASTVLVGYDHRSKAIWAMIVDQKGPTDAAVKWMKGKIDESGNAGTKIVIRSDQEESIIAPKKAVTIRRQAETVLIESPVREQMGVQRGQSDPGQPKFGHCVIISSREQSRRYRLNLN